VYLYSDVPGATSKGPGTQLVATQVFLNAVGSNQSNAINYTFTEAQLVWIGVHSPGVGGTMIALPPAQTLMNFSISGGALQTGTTQNSVVRYTGMPPVDMSSLNTSVTSASMPLFQFTIV
jgi:hypothetical protein